MLNRYTCDQTGKIKTINGLVANGMSNGEMRSDTKEDTQGAVAGAPDPDEDDKDKKSPAKHDEYKDGLRAQMQKPAVKDPELSRIIDTMFRPGAKVGNGSTAAAVRYEMQTNASVQGRLHTQKAQEMAGRLEGWLGRNQSASPGDRAAAENVLRDLRNALSGK